MFVIWRKQLNILSFEHRDVSKWTLLGLPVLFFKPYHHSNFPLWIIPNWNWKSEGKIQQKKFVVNSQIKLGKFWLQGAHDKRRRKCFTCLQSFTPRSVFMDHLNTHRNEEGQMACRFCDFNHIRHRDLVRHYRADHRHDPRYHSKKDRRVRGSTRPVDHEVEARLKCAFCGQGESKFQGSNCQSSIDSVISLIQQPIDCLIDDLISSLSDCSADYSIDWLTDLSIGYVIDWYIDE